MRVQNQLFKVKLFEMTKLTKIKDGGCLLLLTAAFKVNRQ